MKTPKKTEKKKSLKKIPGTDSKKLSAKSEDAKTGAVFADDEDGFDEVPLDELDGFESFNDFDDEDDY